MLFTNLILADTKPLHNNKKSFPPKKLYLQVIFFSAVIYQVSGLLKLSDTPKCCHSPQSYGKNVKSTLSGAERKTCKHLLCPGEMLSADSHCGPKAHRLSSTSAEVPRVNGKHNFPLKSTKCSK